MGSDKYTQNRCHRELRKINECQQFAHTERMSPRIAENQRMSTPNKKFVTSMIILGCNWLTVSKIKKNSGKVWFRWCVMVGREDAKKEVILVYSLVIC